MRRLIGLEFKQIVRERFNLIFLVVMLGYIALVFASNHGLNFFDYAGWAYAQQLLLWWMALVGYKKSAERVNRNYREWMNGIDKNGRVLIAQLASLVVMSVIICIVMMGAYLIFGIVSKISVSYIIDSQKAILLNYFFDTLIAASMGILIGRIFPQNWGYAITLFVVFLMGQMGFSWIAEIGNKVPDVLQRLVFAPLEIGSRTPHRMMDTLYGFSNEGTLWVRRMYLLCLVWIVISLMNQGKRSAVKRTKTTVALAGVVLLCGGFLLINRDYIYDEPMNGPRAYGDDLMVYHEKFDETPNRLTPLFTWTSLALQVNTEGKLEVTGEGQANLLDTTKELQMNLYHGFVVDQVAVDNHTADFQQDGDLLTVTLPEVKTEGETVQVSFHYGGRSMTPFFVGKKAVRLPSYFTWIPQPAMTQNVMSPISISTYSLHGDTPIPVSLEYEGKESCYISSDDAAYTSTGSAAIIAGHCQKTSIDGVTYVFSNDTKTEYMKEASERIINRIEEVSKVLEIETLPVTTVIMTPQYDDQIGNVSSGVRKDGNLLYISSGYIAPQSREDLTGASQKVIEYAENERKFVDYIHGVAPLLLEHPHFMMQENTLQTTFFDALLHYLSGYEPRRADHPEILEFVMNHSDAGEFLREWFHQMDQPEAFTKEDVQALMQEYR